MSSIATTTFQDGGQPILQSKCYMHRQASFYASNWPDGTKVAEDGDVWAFYLPAVDSLSKPVLGGEFVATFRDAPEVKAFAAFLASPTGPTPRRRPRRAAAGSAPTRSSTRRTWSPPIDQQSAKILQDPAAVFRFDGSDMMPSAVVPAPSGRR